MKVLNIVSTGYRATLEEQDDTVLWFSQALRRAGAGVDILLRGSTANYVVEGQQVAPLAIGTRTQRHAPDVHGQLHELASSGAVIYVLQEDLERYGLAECPRLDRVRPVRAAELGRLLSGYAAIWQW